MNGFRYEKMSQKSYRTLRETYNENMDLTLSDFLKARLIMTIVFLNGTYYFLLHILVAYLENFSKYYNKILFL